MDLHYPAMVISGAQTGADRGALIAAAILKYEHGGWVPPGRLAEDGVVPDCYPMTTMTKGGYKERTQMNVECSDATLVFSYEDPLTGGSALTVSCAKQVNLPVLHMLLYPEADKDSNRRVARAIREWLMEKRPRVLNVAGPRESKAEGIQDHVAEIVLLVLQPLTSCICGREIPEDVWQNPKVKEKDAPLRCSSCGHVTRWSDFSWTSLTGDESTSDGTNTDGSESSCKTSRTETSSP
jgi:hypothetical protein